MSESWKMSSSRRVIKADQEYLTPRICPIISENLRTSSDGVKARKSLRRLKRIHFPDFAGDRWQQEGCRRDPRVNPRTLYRFEKKGQIEPSS
jgi:hypothetical protein